MNSKRKLKCRIDELLVQKHFASDLKTAKILVMEGVVFVNSQKITTPSLKVYQDVNIEIKKRCPYVSRGGLKLEGAIEALGIANYIKNSVVLDIGAATGGFTHCVLHYGAKLVIALDVGYGLLDYNLKKDSRVIALENTDFRAFNINDYPKIDIVLIDISFNSVIRNIKFFKQFYNTHFLILIKPQYELSYKDVPKGGVIKDPSLHEKVKNLVENAFSKEGFPNGQWIESPIKGTKGNKEFFYYFYYE